MEDTIVIDPPPNQSTILATVVPKSDGVFIFTLTTKHEANGHSIPTMWGEIFIDGRSDKKSGEIAWKDGPAVLQVTTAESLKANQDYSIMGVSGNRNAGATGIALEVRRA